MLSKHIDASLVFGDPKNYISDEGIDRIASAFLDWREEDKFSRVVPKEEIVKNNYNISPSRYIHVSEAKEFRSISEILEELEVLEKQAEKTINTLKQSFIAV